MNKGTNYDLDLEYPKTYEMLYGILEVEQLNYEAK